MATVRLLPGIGLIQETAEQVKLLPGLGLVKETEAAAAAGISNLAGSGGLAGYGSLITGPGGLAG